MTEAWRAVPGWEGLYEVSDQGRVRSLDRRIWAKNSRGTWNWRTYRGRISETQPYDTGYRMVRCVDHERSETFSVHALVALVFIGPRPEGQHVRHLDGAKTNCVVSNLAYGTPAENAQDTLRHNGFRPRKGEAHPDAKLSEDQVRRVFGTRRSQYLLASEMGVTRSTIADIRQGRTWKHVTQRQP